VARETPARTARQIGEPLPSLRAYRPDLPHELIAHLDACLDPDPERRPPVSALRATLELALPDLDAERPVPAGTEGGSLDRLSLGARAAELTALLAWGGGLAVLAGAAGRPGPALLAGVLSAPAALAFLGPRGVVLPVLAGACALALFLGPAALLGAAPFVAAGVAFGPILRLGHVALALLGALLWSGGVEAALRLVPEGGTPGRPFLVLGAALVAITVEFRWRRAPTPVPRPAILPPNRPLAPTS
jgi:hypothetical protein